MSGKWDGLAAEATQSGDGLGWEGEGSAATPGLELILGD